MLEIQNKTIESNNVAAPHSKESRIQESMEQNSMVLQNSIIQESMILESNSSGTQSKESGIQNSLIQESMDQKSRILESMMIQEEENVESHNTEIKEVNTTSIKNEFLDNNLSDDNSDDPLGNFDLMDHQQTENQEINIDQLASLIKRPINDSIERKIQSLVNESKEELIARILNKIEYRAPQNRETRKTYGGSKRRCGICRPCRTPECGDCENCLDKPWRGGSGKRRRGCEHRICDKNVSTRNNFTASPRYISEFKYSWSIHKKIPTYPEWFFFSKN